ncbi:hypothetical protein Hanom_Chr02g00129501 [Helianthus anomalus]
MDDVLKENKRVTDRENILEMRVKRVEADNKMLIKKMEADNKMLIKKIEDDQTEIDFLKVRVAELEEDKARHDEQNQIF